MNSRPLATLLAVILLAGCNVGPKYQKPDTKVNSKFGGGKSGPYSNDVIITDWWGRFHDAELNSLVRRALDGNKDLQIAASRVNEAKALRAYVRFDYFPTVPGAASYTNNRQSLAQTNGLSFGPRSVEIYSAGFEATWELDLWGRVRHLNKAAAADVATAESFRYETMVSLCAAVAGSYLELRGLQNQLDVARRNVDNQRDALKITENLLQGGRGTELDTSRAQAQLNGTLAAIPFIESAISKDIHRISVLIGQQPTVLTGELFPAKAMPKMPSLVRIGNPADLLRRRPDIAAAESSLQSATEKVGVATADLFPAVTFNGTAAIQANSLSGPGSAATSFGPHITWAAFNLGRVKAQLDAAGARAEGQLASYEQTVLGALEETENALVQYGHERTRGEYLRAAAEASEHAAKLAKEVFEAGKTDFLTVTDANRTLLLAQSELASSETTTATALVAIYKALGGGWEGR